VMDLPITYISTITVYFYATRILKTLWKFGTAIKLQLLDTG